MTEEEFCDAIRQIEEYSAMAETFQNEAERLKQCVKEYMTEHCLNDVEVDGRRVHRHADSTTTPSNGCMRVCTKNS